MVELKEKRLRKSISEAKNEWQGQKDLNPRHAVLETAALPTELYPYIPILILTDEIMKVGSANLLINFNAR